MNAELHDIAHLIRDGHLVSAFGAIRAKITSADTELTYRLDTLYETYRHSLLYYISGAEDPERDKIVTQLRIDLLGVALELEYRQRMRRGDHLRQYIRSLSPLSILEVLAMIDLKGNGVIDPRLAEGLLEAVWTSRSLSEEETEALLRIEDEYLQSIVLSGVLFALDYYPSISHIRYLMRSALSFEAPALRARSVVGLVFASSYSWMPIWEDQLRGELDMIIELDTSLKNWFLATIRAFYQTQSTPVISRIVAEGMKRLTQGLFSGLSERFRKSLEQGQIPNIEGEAMSLDLSMPNPSDAPEVLRIVQEGFDVSYEGVKRIYQSMVYQRSMLHYLVPVSRRDPTFSEVSDISAQEIRVLSMQCDSDAYLLWPMMQRADSGMPIDLRTLQRQLQMHSEGAELPERKYMDYVHSYLRGLYRLVNHAPGRLEVANFFDFDPLDLQTRAMVVEEGAEDMPSAVAATDVLPLLGRYVEGNERLWLDLEHIFAYQDLSGHRELCLRILVKLSPGRADYYDQLALILMAKEDWSEALTQLTIADLIAGSNIERQVHIARCHRMLGHIDRSVSILLDLSTSLVHSEDRSNYASCLVDLALAYTDAERWDDALRVWDEYEVAFGALPVKLGVDKAKMLFMLQRYDEAWAIIEICLADPSASLYTLIIAGHICLGLGHMEHAVELYRRAYKEDQGMFEANWDYEVECIRSIPNIQPGIAQAIMEYLNF